MFYFRLGLILLVMTLFLTITQYVEHVPTDNPPLIHAILIITLGGSIFLFVLHYLNRHDEKKK